MIVFELVAILLCLLFLFFHQAFFKSKFFKRMIGNDMYYVCRFRVGKFFIGFNQT
jgi:hypothetical protein